MASDEQKSVLQVLVEMVDQVSEPLRKINENFEEFSSNLGNIAISAGEIFAGYEMLTRLAEPAMAFQQAQARLALATKGSTEELAKFKEQAEEISRTLPVGLENITKAQTQLYQTFRDVEETKRATEFAAKLATVLGVDATTGAKILSSAVQNLGEKGRDPVEQMGVLGDKLAIMKDLFPAGAAGAGRMAMELGRLGTVANQFRLTQNQVFGLWGELNRLNKGGARGGAQQAVQMIEQLAKVNESGISSLSRYGVALAWFDKAHTKLNLMATIEALHNKGPVALAEINRHLTGAGAILGQLAEHFNDLKSSFYDFKDGAGELNKASQILADTPQAKMERLRNTIANLADTIGTQVLPQLIYLVDRMSAFVHWIDELSEAHPGLTKIAGDIILITAGILTLSGLVGFGKMIGGILKLGAGLTGVGTMLAMMGNLWAAACLVATEGIGSIGAALGLLISSNPVGWIIAGVAALALVSYEVWKHWDAIVGTISRAAEAVKGFFSSGMEEYVKALSVQYGVPEQVALPGGSSVSSSAAHIEQTNHISITMEPGADAHDVGAAVKHELDDHAENLRGLARLSFADAGAN